MPTPVTRQGATHILRPLCFSGLVWSNQLKQENMSLLSGTICYFGVP